MARPPLRVAFLTSARAWRGSGVSLCHIAHGLIGRGHRVHMLAGELPVLQEFERRGLPASRVPTKNTGLRAARALAQTLGLLQANCLVVDRPRDLRLGALARLIHPLALINRYNLSRESPPRDLLSRLAYYGVRLTIFVSESNAQQALSRAGYLRKRPYRVIPEGVDPIFQPDQVKAREFCARYDLSPQGFVLAVGSLTADKRYEFLFEVMRCLGSEAPSLVICGGGPLKDRLRAQAADLQVDAKFLGLVDSDLLPGAYTAATLFVHACEIETFGLSVLEAMSCGCPIIAAAGGAVPEVVADAGVLIPTRDPESYAAVLRSLLSNPSLQRTLGQAAQERARKFSLDQMQQSYAEAIEQASGHVGTVPSRS
jgi:glycosyltransferase involved in cell wall biosynthesis